MENTIKIAERQTSHPAKSVVLTLGREVPITDIVCGQRYRVEYEQRGELRQVDCILKQRFPAMDYAGAAEVLIIGHDPLPWNDLPFRGTGLPIRFLRSVRILGDSTIHDRADARARVVGFK